MELRIGIVDNWEVDCTDSRVTDHTIDLLSLLEVINLKNRVKTVLWSKDG